MNYSIDHWIHEGMTSLYQEGPSGIRVDRLCKRLSVTKGSFYHHFENLNDFKQKLLDHWEQECTQELIQKTHDLKSSKSKILALKEMSSKIPRSPEIAVRVWALHDTMARQYLNRVDRMRFKALETLYSSYFSKEEARLRARLVCCLFVGAQQLTPAVSRNELENMYEFIAQIKNKAED